MKKDTKIGRRIVLKGIGAAGISVALPPLDLHVDPTLRSNIARAADEPTRMVLFHFCHGAEMLRWTPPKDGAQWWGAADPSTATIPQCLEPMRRHLRDINVVSGLSNLRGYENAGVLEHNHARGSLTLFTGRSVVNNTSGTSVGPGGPSVDQFAAQILGKTTAQAMVGAALSHDRVNRTYEDKVSWVSGSKYYTLPLKPTQIFDQVFSNASVDPNSASNTVVQKRQSVLNYVRARINVLKPKLGVADRQRLDQHLSQITDIEHALQAQSAGPLTCTLPSRPSTADEASTTASGPPDGDQMTFTQRYKLLMDLMALSLVCNQTRVLTYSVGGSSSVYIFPFITPTGAVNTTIDEHSLSHLSAGLPDMQTHREYWTRAVQWKIEQFAYLMDKLKAPLANGKSLLDYSAVVCTSEMSTGRGHCFESLPVLVAGKLGNMTTGQHLRFPCAPLQDSNGDSQRDLIQNAPVSCSGNGKTSISRLWLSMLQATGIPAASFGQDGTSTLPGLWG